MRNVAKGNVRAYGDYRPPAPGAAGLLLGGLLLGEVVAP
jgi:hypothetical protein